MVRVGWGFMSRSPIHVLSDSPQASLSKALISLHTYIIYVQKGTYPLPSGNPPAWQILTPCTALGSETVGGRGREGQG